MNNEELTVYIAQCIPRYAEEGETLDMWLERAEWNENNLERSSP